MIGKIILVGFVLVTLNSGCTGLNQTTSNSAFSAGGDLGEFGGDLRVLRRSFTRPQLPGESNYYVDLMNQSLRSFALAQGLTNNRTLFVLSHGKALPRGILDRYALYATATVPAVGYYSPRDLAQLLGEKANEVHNLVLAGCNVEGAFMSREFKRYFPNATNITHALPNTDATVDTFQNILSHSSSEIRLGLPGSLGPFFGENPRGANGPYIAELYRPGDGKPYKKQPAGRELLAPLPGTLQMASSSHTNRSARFVTVR